MNHLLRSARPVLYGLGALAALLPNARADVPEELPARFQTHVTDRYTLAGTIGGRTVKRRGRLEADRAFVFEDGGALRFEGELAYPMSATWRRVSRHIATFRLTPETIEAYRAYASGLIGVEGPMRVTAGVARLRFSADGASFRGTGRYTVRMRVRGVAVTLTENVLYEGTTEF